MALLVVGAWVQGCSRQGFDDTEDLRIVLIQADAEEVHRGQEGIRIGVSLENRIDKELGQIEVDLSFRRQGQAVDSEYLVRVDQGNPGSLAARGSMEWVVWVDVLAEAQPGLVEIDASARARTADGREVQAARADERAFWHVAGATSFQIWSGNQPVGDVNLVVGESLELNGVLVDPEGDRIQDGQAAWLLVGGAFPVDDLSWDLPASARATFTPSRVGTLVIHATYNGDYPDVDPDTATTGLVQVTQASSPARMLLVSGDAQTGIVDQVLSQPLVVQVLDQDDRPVAGVMVTFRVLQGEGAPLDPATLATDSAGQAAKQVRLGTTAGQNNQMFRAELSEDPALFVDFVASALAGTGTQLLFLAQPSLAVATAPFAERVEVAQLDAFGNTTHSTEVVDLTVATGTGSLTGTTSVAMQSGLAVFGDVAYDTPEAGVVIRASSGDMWVDSQPFDVDALPPGQCQLEDELFRTFGGGCMDMTTGLVWSNRSPGTMVWPDAVWDAMAAGGFPADEWDLGRTNDYPEDTSSPCTQAPDSSAESYCHFLEEGGRLDWRMPTRSELVDLAGHMQMGNPPYLQSQSSTWIWSSTTENTHKYTVNLDTGEVVNLHYLTSSLPVYCVRGGRHPPDHLEVLSGPGGVGVGHPGLDLTVAVREPDGSQVNRQGLTVRIESADLGTPSGNLEATTNRAGTATLDNWILDTPGRVTLTITAEGLAPAHHTLTVGQYPHTCALEDDQFQTTEGGCKHLVTGMVWSQVPEVYRTWHEAIWDSESPAGNDPPDQYDGTRTNDYDGSPGTGPDASMHDYCHDLEEGGFQDWRVPTLAELEAVWAFGEGSATHFGLPADRYFHSGKTEFTQSMNYIVNLATGNVTNNPKATPRATICVRQGS